MDATAVSVCPINCVSTQSESTQFWDNFSRRFRSRVQQSFNALTNYSTVTSNNDSVYAINEKNSNFGSHDDQGVAFNLDNKCAESKPAILNQSRSTKMLQAHPDDFLSYPASPNYFHFKAVTFYIGKPFNDNVSLPEPEELLITINHPSGARIPVNIRNDPDFPKTRLICSFIATNAGFYTGFVQFMYMGVPRLIKGSPFEISVSREYGSRLMKFYGMPQFPIFREDTRADRCWGLDVDRVTGNIYLCDKISSQIRVFTSSGMMIGEFGNPDGSFALWRPSGIAVDATNERVIIADKDNHRVCIWTLDGLFISAFGKKGHSDGELHYPWGIAVSPDGELIVVSDSRNHRLQMFDKFGNFLTKYSPFENNPFEYKQHLDYPRGICFSNSGEQIFVSDFNQHQVYVFNKELTIKHTFAHLGNTSRTQGIAADAAGNIIVCDSRNNCAQVFSPRGDPLFRISGDRSFIPVDVAVLPNGNLAIVDNSGAVHIY